MDLSDPYSDSSLPPLHTRYPQPVPHSAHHAYYVKQEPSYPPQPPTYHRTASTPSASSALSASHYHGGHSPMHSPSHSGRHAAHEHYSASTPFSSSSAVSSPDDYYVHHDHHRHHYSSHHQHAHSHAAHSPPPHPIALPATSITSAHVYSPHSHSHTDSSYDLFGASTDSIPLPLDDEPVYAVQHTHPHAAAAVQPPVIALGPPPSSPPPAAKRRSRAHIFSPHAEHEPVHYTAAISPPATSMPYAAPSAAGGSYYAVPSYNEHASEPYGYTVSGDSSLQDEAMSVGYPSSYPAAVPVRAASPLPPLSGGDVGTFASQDAVAAIVVRSDSPSKQVHRHGHELMEGEGSMMHEAESERELTVRSRPLSPSRARSYSQADIHSLHQQQHHPHHTHQPHQHLPIHHAASHQQPVAYYEDGRRVDVYRVDSVHSHSHSHNHNHSHSHDRHSHPHHHSHVYEEVSMEPTNGLGVPPPRGHSILTSPVSQPPAYSSFSSSTPSSSHNSPRSSRTAPSPASLSVLHQLQAEISAATAAGADSSYIAAKFQQAKDVQRAIMQETMAAGGAAAATTAHDGHHSMYEDNGSTSTGSSPHSHGSSLGRSSPCQHGHERHPHVHDAVPALEGGVVKHEMGMSHRDRERERDSRERAAEGGWVDAQHHYGRGHHQHQHSSHHPHSLSHAHAIPTATYIPPPSSAAATFASPIHSPSTHSTPSPPASVSTASSSDSRPRYSPFPSHAPPPHPPAVSAYPTQSNFAVPPPPAAARSNKRTRSRSEGYSADAHVPGLPAHTQAAHMGGTSVSSQGRDRPATATHHYYHHHHHPSHSQQPQPALAVPHYGRTVSSHVGHSAALLSPSAGAVSSAAPFSSLRAVQEHEHDEGVVSVPYHVHSEHRIDTPPAALSLPAPAAATVIPPPYSSMSSAQQRSSARTFSAPHSAILIDSSDRYHAHASAPSTPIHSPHYGAPPTSYSAAASPAHRRVIVKARSSSNASSAPVLAPSPAYTVASAGSSGDEVPLLRLHGSSRPNTGESGSVRSTPQQRSEPPSHHALPPAIDTQLEVQSHPSPYGSRHSSPTSSSTSSTPPPFRSPTHRPFSFARAPSPRHGVLSAQPQPQQQSPPTSQQGSGSDWKAAERPAQSVPVAAAVKVDEVRVKVEPRTDPVPSASGTSSVSVPVSVGAAIVVPEASSGYSSMEVSTPYSSSTASTATSSNPSSTSASPLVSPLQFTAAPPLSDALSLQPPLRFSLSATTPSTTTSRSEQSAYPDVDDESLEHPSPLQSSLSGLSSSAPLDSPLARMEATVPLPSPSPPSAAAVATPVAAISPPLSSTPQPVPATATVAATSESATTATTASSAALSAQMVKKLRKKRRKSTDLPEHERWYCPLACGKYFRRTSSRSITEHMKNCPSISKKTDTTAADGSGSEMSGNGLTVRVMDSDGGESVHSASSVSSGGLFSPVTGGLSSAMKELHLQPLRELEAAGHRMDATGEARMNVDAAAGDRSGVNGVSGGGGAVEGATLASDDEDDDGDDDYQDM